MNNSIITSSLVAEMQEIGESAHLLEQAQDQGNTGLTLELLTHLKVSMEDILEEIIDLFECQEKISTEDLHNEYA